MYFHSPENLQNLRLASLNISDFHMTELFESLRWNTYLQRLRLSGICMSNNKNISLLCEFLEANEILSELDLSYCGLSVQQLCEIFRALPHSLSLAYLNIAFNTNEYSRTKEQSEMLFELINNFLLSNSKLIHLDLSGCNLG